MADTNLGRVSLVPRGRYDPLVTYKRLDVVSYGGDSWLVLKDTTTGTTPAKGENYMLLADGALVVVSENTGAEVALTMQNNVEYRCTDPVTSLTINDFAPGEQGRADLWAIQFTAGETITVIVPDSVIWAVAEPVFSTGSAYWLTFTPFADKYLGVWVEVEADEQTDV